MTVQISNRLDGKCFPVDFNFVGFHHFLNLSTDFAQLHVDTSSLRGKLLKSINEKYENLEQEYIENYSGKLTHFNTRIGGFTNSLNQLIELWVERQRPSTIDYPS